MESRQSKSSMGDGYGQVLPASLMRLNLELPTSGWFEAYQFQQGLVGPFRTGVFVSLLSEKAVRGETQRAL